MNRLDAAAMDPLRRSHGNGYAPLRDYAAIGDGRTVALVSRDGSIDWLCLPNLDSPSVFGALLDSRRGGSFSLAPDCPYETNRRYVPDTNVLETTFSTATGVVRVTDAMTLHDERLGPERELVRRVEGISGRVPMQWSVEPRFGYSFQPTSLGHRLGIPVATGGGDALAVHSWNAGKPECRLETVAASFETEAGTTALLSLSSAHRAPLVLPGRDEVDRRLDSTIAYWRRWLAGRTYQGPWREAVVRSVLALKLLVFAPSGAVAAAASASLPEAIGGERNWDYRFCWVRDSAFTLDALMRLGCAPEAHAFFWWLMHASQLTHPQLQVLYRLDGGASVPETTIDLKGYRCSRPVRVGNAAADQLQLDVYGDLLQTAWLYAAAGNRLDPDFGRRLARVADYVCRIWRMPDRGIWEVRSEPVHFTHSKLMCWVALDRACRLAAEGQLPADRAGRWRSEAEAIRAFVESHCWSPEKRSYVRFPGNDELDASLLLGILMRYGDPEDERLLGTLEAVERELAHGPLLYRYTGEDGLQGGEGSFITCSFWLVEALVHCGQVDRAADVMEQLLALANDVGLYSEEIDPRTGEFLGNLPQALVHLALVNAATSFAIGDAE